MAEVRDNTWHEDLPRLMEDTGISYAAAAASSASGEESLDIFSAAPIFDGTMKMTSGFMMMAGQYEDHEGEKNAESLKEHAAEFLKSWGEMLMDLGKGCKDIVEQSLVTEDSFIVQKLGKPMAKVSARLRFLNDFLPEDRDPLHAWFVIFFVFILSVAALSVNTTNDRLVTPVKKVQIHPPSAHRIQLPDGRHLAYHEQGVPTDRARFSMVAPHAFLSSRLAGIPGVKTSLLEEFGVRLITYDLPGFGESDPHPSRNLNSSAFDMLHLADAVGITDKFWVLGYSSGSMHSWAALKHIPDRIAGAAMFAPMISPYEQSMLKEEMRSMWDQWLPRRKLMYFLARKFPSFLSLFYHRSFLSGNHGQIDKWLSLSLGRKDELLIKEPAFEEFWRRDVEESIRRWSTKPFIEEAVLQVSNWGFSLSELQVQKKCESKGVFHWLKSMYSQAECKLAGFHGPIHIWQGLDDSVVPPSVTDYISRVLPGAILHKLPNEGHFSYIFLCDDCHRRIFSILFGEALGPLQKMVEMDESQFAGEIEETSSAIGSAME